MSGRPDVMTATAAKTRAAGIRRLIGGMTARVAAIEIEMAEAYRLRDWEALGYPDWTAYCQGEYGDTLGKLDRKLRTAMRAELTTAGASTGEIAAACRVERKTIQRDIAATNVAVTVVKPPPAPPPAVRVVKVTPEPAQNRVDERLARGDIAVPAGTTSEKIIHEGLVRQRNAQIKSAAAGLLSALNDSPAADDSPSAVKLLHDVLAVLRDRLWPGGPAVGSTLKDITTGHSPYGDQQRGTS